MYTMVQDFHFMKVGKVYFMQVNKAENKVTFDHTCFVCYSSTLCSAIF